MIKMTLANTDSPLRRSDFGAFRETVQNVTINDDEEERRESRRLTLLQKRNQSSGLFEENETLKKCLEIYNGNKLSKENAWSLSLIDTLSTLLDKHHKSLNNFKVAGSSLEASSKVYGLRVDSIHTDVLRMSAGLNAKTFSAGHDMEEKPDEKKKSLKPKTKKTRKNLSTVTKNKESLNARLDTVPLVDPVFGKLNSIFGNNESCNRLLQNILLSTDSELRLCLNFPFWDNSTPEKIDYTEEINDFTKFELLEWKILYDSQIDNQKLRPIQSGYIISDTPDESECIKKEEDITKNSNNNCTSPIIAPFEDDLHQMSMAFDINAECEPIPPLASQTAIVNVDFADYDDLTNDERVAITHCKGLRKAPILIEDLRPIDASSKLEYSYRPLDEINQFWAGPSHWKFKKLRNRGTMFSQRLSQQLGSSNEVITVKTTNQCLKRKAINQERAKQLNFTECHDDLFVKLDQSKLRKTNAQKKWDHRKLKLPNDLQIDSFIFDKFHFAPGIRFQDDINNPTVSDLQNGLHYTTDDAIGIGINNDFSNNNDVHVNASSLALHTNCLNDDGDNHDDGICENDDCHDMNLLEKTVLEIATDFEGAPRQVTKIIVPFAKRAKVIDMKKLKEYCYKLMLKHFNRTNNSSDMNKSIQSEEKNHNENYSPGESRFHDIYKELPLILNPSMSEALSPSILFYSILHLANDYNLRLIQQDDLKDFKILKIV